VDTLRSVAAPRRLAQWRRAWRPGRQGFGLVIV